MDLIFQVLHIVMLGLYVVTFLAVVLKIILVIYFKGPGIPAILMSFFRIYKRSEKESTSNRKRKTYMMYNNYINYYLYFFIALFLLLLIIYRGGMFNYS